MAKNRLVKILLLPIAAVIFMIGFILCATPGTRKQKKHDKPVSKNTSPTFEIGVLLPQENQPSIYTKQKEDT